MADIDSSAAGGGLISPADCFDSTELWRLCVFESGRAETQVVVSLDGSASWPVVDEGRVVVEGVGSVVDDGRVVEEAVGSVVKEWGGRRGSSAEEGRLSPSLEEIDSLVWPGVVSLKYLIFNRTGHFLIYCR